MITLKPESPSGHDLALLETVEFKWYRVCGLILAKWTDFLCRPFFLFPKDCSHLLSLSPQT